MKKMIKIGNVLIGGGHKIAIQSMTNTKTKDVAATVSQIKALTQAGVDIVRVAVVDLADAQAIAQIKPQITVPLVADIHFDYRLALEAVAAGVDKLRINPGNLRNKDQIRQVVAACQEKQLPIRIGINGGSLDPKYPEVTKETLIASAREHINLLEELGYTDIVLSIKTTDIEKTIENSRVAIIIE